MKVLPAVCLLLATLGHAGTASAQATRTWISATGDDEDSCSRISPCATFAGALANTNPGGEIDVLDPLGPGTVTVNKSVTLNAEGTIASVLFSGTTGITINASGGRVIIRHVSFLGGGTGIRGIHIVNAASVTLENCQISGFVDYGVNVESSSPVSVVIRNTSIEGGSIGVRIAGTGAATANIQNLSVSGAQHGVRVTNGNAAVTVDGSQLHGNTKAAVSAIGSAVVNVTDSTLSSNAVAIDARGQSAIRISNNAIFDNEKAYVRQGNASIATAGDNRTGGNGGGAGPLNATLTLQ